MTISIYFIPSLSIYIVFPDVKGTVIYFSIQISPFKSDIQVTQKWQKWQPGATLFSVLLGIFALVLGRYGGAMDLAIASPVANRNGWDPQILQIFRSDKHRKTRMLILMLMVNPW